jgi:pimeloyl-ACP methyl ester carboxylesterase
VRGEPSHAEILLGPIAPTEVWICIRPDPVRSAHRTDRLQVKTPTLLITGEKSPALLRRLTDRLQELVPNAQRVNIAGASHLMHYEKPSPVNAAVLDFIAAH